MTARRWPTPCGRWPDWDDAVSIGFPGVVANDHTVAEPRNLGPGWVRFDYPGAFDRR